MSGFVCENLAPEQDGNLPLWIATVISNGRVSGKALKLGEKIAPMICGIRSVAELTNLKLSELQANRLLAAIGIGRELWSHPPKKGDRVCNSSDLFARYRARFFGAGKEYFVALYLNAKNQLIRESIISIGSLSTSIVHPRELFSEAVRLSSAALIVMHNHPTGDPAPSREDRECTQRILQAGKILGIRVLDHIVFGHEDYFSFADSGLMTEA